MPLGGLRWKHELEKKEFKKVKSEIQVFGIDDAPFEPGEDHVKIVAVLSRGAKMLDGVFHTEIKRDGLDATDRIARLINDIKRENAQAIILDGVTFGGFNVVDIQRLYKATNIPVIATLQKRPNHAKINEALKNLDEKELRASMIKQAGPVHEIKLQDGTHSYYQSAGLSKKDAEEIIRTTTIKGLVPEPVRAAHLIAKGAYTEVHHDKLDIDEAPHKKAFLYVKHKHKQAKRLKRRLLPGMVGELFSFLFAVLIAWLIIQFLGFLLATPSPLVVIESGSMIHEGSEWKNWHLANMLDPVGYAFDGGMNIGDIVLVVGDSPDDIGVGDVIVYDKYGPGESGVIIGGEPIIHRVVGIVEINGSSVTGVFGAVNYDDGKIITPCNDASGYSVQEIRNIYSVAGAQEKYPDLQLDNFRVFFTKGDNNAIEDQCKTGGLIAYPIHEEFVIGRARFDVPYLGYVKLGLVCAFRYTTGNVCECTCWWSADNPKCCR